MVFAQTALELERTLVINSLMVLYLDTKSSNEDVCPWCFVNIKQTNKGAKEIKCIPMISPSMLTVLSRIPLLWAGIYPLGESALVYAC